MRASDPLSKPSRLKALLAEISEDLKIEKGEVVSLLHAASSFERNGRRSSRYPEALLEATVAKIRAILERESHNRVSLRTFVDNYLRVLSCPDDLQSMLENGEVTLFEALQLKRLSALSLSKEESVKTRHALIEECRQKGWTAHHLRAEVDALLKPSRALPLDFPDFISEQCHQLLSLLAGTDYSRMTEQERNELLAAIDAVILKLQRLGKQKERIRLGLV